jgi:hypothetical protein
MVNLYRESPEYQDVLRVLGPEKTKAAENAQDNDNNKRTYPTSLMYGIHFSFFFSSPYRSAESKRDSTCGASGQ